jgi:hypothetical protein
VCVSKTPAPALLMDYRPITLLNSHYKVYVRILANRLRTTLSGLLNPSQNRAASGTTTLNATSGLRDIVEHGEMRARRLCLLALDFTSAFNRLSRRYLERIISYYGFGRKFAKVLMSLYTEAESSLQLNGYRSTDFPM